MGNVMRSLCVALTTVLLTTSARAQLGAINGPQSAGKVGRPAEEPAEDRAKKKADEKAFSDAVKRIPAADKKYDPWGNVRSPGK